MRNLRLGIAISVAALTWGGVFAFGVKKDQSRFDDRSIPDPSLVTDVASRSLEELPPASGLRLSWDGFSLGGERGRVQIDVRSGAPLLVEVPGMKWPVPPPEGAAAGEGSLRELEASLRAFLAENRDLLLAKDGELVLDENATGPMGGRTYQVVFGRRVNGVPVEGDRYVFTFGHGNLLAFGASRWTTVEVETTPSVEAPLAIETLMAYMGLADRDAAKLMAAPTLRIVPKRSEGGEPHSSAYVGEIGGGYASALVWRIVLQVDDESGIWVGMVDAHSGEVLSFFDDVRYAQVKGGVHPESPDGICPSGCEQPGYPMPFANVSINAGPDVASNAMGMFSCTPVGGTAVTLLRSPTIRIADVCGAVNESTICSAGGDLDLSINSGTNCTVPAGHSVGDTKASRSCFWTANRLKEHARTWLTNPTAVNWVTNVQTQVNANVNSTCNANWSGGQLNMFRATAPSPTGCNNTCEVAGVVQHEWGHGMDENDGGGFDNTSEGYADISELLADHTSCIGRGFFMGQTCTGYGDTCLTCTGIRDANWDARTRHTPSRIGVAGNLIASCSSGGGPCGKEVHCEGYLVAETVYDLATRDLPAAGYDQATSWFLADRLWYQSRNGSTGNHYTCTAGSGGCAASSLFARMRTADDDDGNLLNGTPHAAALFAAFARHDIACGAAGDASNQSTAFPPVVSSLVLSGAGNSNSANLSWLVSPLTPDAAASYRILRNDVSCDYTFTLAGTTPGETTSFSDTGLANGFKLYYRVQAVGTNAAHESALSNCVEVIPQPFAGTVVLDQPAYSCADLVGISVVDGNIGGSTVDVEIRSTTESTPESVTLTQVSPGDATYTGSIATTSGPAAADGQLSVTHGDTITVAYIDADDGNGNTNVLQEATATVDCAPPIITNVASSNVTGNSALVTWDTNEAADSRVHYGATPPPGSTSSLAALVTSHSVPLTGLAECTPYVFSVESADLQGNDAADDNGGTYYAFATGRNVNPSYPSTSPPIPIPDNNPAGASMVIAVPDNKPVLDVDVRVNITHTWDSDITVSLIPPVGAPIMLANRRGSSGDNFTNTVFDDEAATPISAGTAPFTGSFRPDSPLSAADGITAAGNWTLKVVDVLSGFTGTVDNWTLTLLYPNQACGPHAKVDAHATVADVCASGGGGGNGYWDAGETVQFSVTVGNDGSDPLTGVSASVTSPTPGIVIVDGSATYPDLAAGVGAASDAPHYTVQVPAAAACGSDLQFDVQVSSAQGSWSGSFTHKAGQLLPASATVLDETFAGGIPGTWTVIDGGTGGGAAATWTTANPGSRVFTSPLAAPVAIVDSDNAGSGGPTQDEQLITPVLDLSSATAATLQFDQFFRWFSGGLDEKGDVDVRSSLTGGAWVNVFRNQGASSPNPDHKTIDVAAQAAGAADVQIRFHYYDAQFEWWWQVDNIKVDVTLVPGCAMTACTSAGTAKPVAQMTASRVDATTIDVDWDVATCISTDHEILYGDLASVATYALSGSVCGIGTSGSTTWSGVPAGNLWFLVTGADGAGTEATWGLATAGHRNGGTASGQCGNAARDNGASCP